MRKLPTFAAVLAMVGGLPPGASGQDAGRSMEELERLILAQQQQLEAQQAQLDRQRKLLEELQRQVKEQTAPKAANATGRPPAAPALAKSPPPVSDPRPIAGRSGAGPPGIYQHDKHDWQHPTASQFKRGDHSKTLEIPGTNTEVGIHGFVELQAFHDTRSLDNSEFFPSQIPLDDARSRTWFTPNFSRLELSTATPSDWGRLNTYFEADFSQDTTSHTPEFRLRHAYAEIGHAGWETALLVGQTWPGTVDLKGVPETLDYAGPVGGFSGRRPLLRLTRPFGGLTAEWSLESPDSADYADASRLTRWPDVSLAGSREFDGDFLKHLRAGGMIRDLRAESTTGADDAELGWVVFGSGKLGLPFLGARGNLRFSANYGEGFGSLISNVAVDAAFNDLTQELETIPIVSVQGGLQHWWVLGRLRSNLVGGYLETNPPGFVDRDTLDHAAFVAANLIWTPHENLSFGFEYLWGQRETVSGESGNASRYVFSSKLQF